MKTSIRSLLLVGALAAGGLGLTATPARAQYGLGFVSPGLSFGVGSGVYGGLYGGYPLVAPAPVVVARPPVIVPAPVFVPRPYYGGFYPGGYRPYYHHYYRR